jgi:hexosaminidase
MVKRFTILLLALMASVSIKGAEMKTIAVIPQPAKISVGEGRFVLVPNTTIVVSEEVRSVGEYLAQQLAPATGFNLEVEKISDPNSSKKHCIMLRTSPEKNYLGQEGYELEVAKDRVIVDAYMPAGVFYACQTLRQLLPSTIESKKKIQDVVWTIPCVEIQDKPRFQWRGLLLDCSRTFLPKEYIKRHIDLLAYHKMNIMQLHLTDDQGWRIEIKKYPELTTIGSKFSPKYKGEINGYYSQQDIREIVKYAASRYVTIVPEFEMPGHCLAALASYPELSCTGGPFEICPYMAKDIADRVVVDVFCVGNEKTFTFIEDVLNEVVELFPSKYIHIGGDECPTIRWTKCTKCQARLKAEGLKHEGELESYFVKRVAKILESKNRIMVGWDEILLGGTLPPRTVVMSWRGISPGITAAKAGYDVVMSPAIPCYLDHLLSDKKVNTRTIYAYDPIPLAYSYELTEPTEADASHILGALVPMWTHIARNEDAIERQIYPRLVAMAEVVWSPNDSKDWCKFVNRLKVHCERLDTLGVKFYRDPVIWSNE